MTQLLNMIDDVRVEAECRRLGWVECEAKSCDVGCEHVDGLEDDVRRADEGGVISKCDDQTKKIVVNVHSLLDILEGLMNCLAEESH